MSGTAEYQRVTTCFSKCLNQTSGRSNISWIGTPQTKQKRRRVTLNLLLAPHITKTPWNPPWNLLEPLVPSGAFSWLLWGEKLCISPPSSFAHQWKHHALLRSPAGSEAQREALLGLPSSDYARGQFSSQDETITYQTVLRILFLACLGDIHIPISFDSCDTLISQLMSISYHELSTKKMVNRSCVYPYTCV